MLTTEIVLNYDVIAHTSANIYLLRRKSDGVKFICRVYPGSRVENQDIIDKYETFAGIEGVTQLVDIVTEYETPGYSFVGTMHDVPVSTSLVLTVIQESSSLLEMITRDTPITVVRLVLKYILTTLINMHNRGLEFLQFDLSNVIIDTINGKTLICDLTTALLGTGEGVLAAQFALFLIGLTNEAGIHNRELSRFIRYASTPGTTLADLVLHSFLRVGEYHV